MYNMHCHISTQEVSISANNGHERITLRNIDVDIDVGLLIVMSAVDVSG